MAKKVRRRTVTSDDGDSVRFVTVVESQRIVEDERNGVLFTGADGNEAFVPMSANAMRNTGAWFNAA